MRADAIPEKELEIMIPSRDVRQYAKDVEWDFTDLQRAALLIHSNATESIKANYLKSLAEDAEDENIRDQIKRYLADSERCMMAMQDNGSGEFVYLLYFGNWYPRRRPDAYVADWDSAYKMGVLSGTRFTISKEYVSKNPNDEPKPGAAEYRYDAQGEVASWWSSCDGEPQPFELAFYSIPCPFRHGDVVQTVGDEGEPTYGVVDLISTWEEYVAHMIESTEHGGFPADDTDVQVRVADLTDNGNFCHVHINPVWLEYFNETDTPRADLLNSLGHLYTGRAMIESLYYYTMKYRESVGRNRYEREGFLI